MGNNKKAVIKIEMGEVEDGKVSVNLGMEGEPWDIAQAYIRGMENMNSTIEGKAVISCVRKIMISEIMEEEENGRE